MLTLRGAARRLHSISQSPRRAGDEYAYSAATFPPRHAAPTTDAGRALVAAPPRLASVPRSWLLLGYGTRPRPYTLRTRTRVPTSRRAQSAEPCTYKKAASQSTVFSARLTLPAPSFRGARFASSASPRAPPPPPPPHHHDDKNEERNEKTRVARDTGGSDARQVGAPAAAPFRRLLTGTQVNRFAGSPLFSLVCRSPTVRPTGEARRPVPLIIKNRRD